MRQIILFIVLSVVLMVPTPSLAQCAEVEEAIKDIVRYQIHPIVEDVSYDSMQRVTCYSLKQMKEDEFVLLGRGMEYSELIVRNPDIEYLVLRMINRDMCEYVFIRRVSRSQHPVNQRLERQKVLNQLKAKQDNLAILKKRQAYLNTDVMNILGDVLVSQIDAPAPFQEIVSKAAGRLKDKGIREVSKYYDIEYFPSNNENADVVRKIVSPIDDFLSTIGVPTGKWLKYWEAIKLAPDGGMMLGNVAAKVRIYFMQKELEEEIAQLNSRIDEIDAKNVISPGSSR